MIRHFFAALAGLVISVSAAQAAPILVDEATIPGAGGDYNNLLSPIAPSTHIFDLGAGTNVFSGSIVTPGDQGDTMAIELGAGETLTGISVTFYSNANASDFSEYLAISQGTRFLLEESSTTPLLVELTFADTFFSLNSMVRTAATNIGTGIYTMTMLTGVLGLSTGNPVDYEITLTVDGPPPVSNVPAPAALGLMLIGLAGLRMARRKS